MHLIVRFLLAGRTPNVSLGWPFRHSTPGSNAMYLIVLIVVYGTAARLLAASAGHNYDMESYWIVAGHADAGDNVYVSTLILLGWLWRRHQPVDRLLLYSLTVVVFAPAIANQYLAIPMAAVPHSSTLGILPTLWRLPRTSWPTRREWGSSP